MTRPWPDDLLQIPHRRDVPFDRLTTLGVGGLCRWLFEPRTEAQAQAFIRACVREALPWKILGGGSNLLVLGDLSMPVLRLRLEPELRREGDCLSAPASFGHIRFSMEAAALGLSGMEHAAGIPGTLGGALRMNAGAYGRELAEVLASFRFLTPQGDLVEKAPEPGDFRYRGSFLTGGHLALALKARLVPGDPAALRAAMETHRAKRGGSQPLGTRNAGCIFKNPPGLSAGRLIDDAGLKGLKVGEAQVSLEHANFLVNLGRATPAQFGELMATVQAAVLARHGVALEPEVEIWKPDAEGWVVSAPQEKLI